MPSPMPETDLLHRLADRINDGPLLAPGEGVLVGVSGGVDSVVLLDLLAELAGEQDRRYRLTVGHLDHRLRSESADEAEFVADLARAHSLPILRERVDVRSLADASGEGIEHAARQARYGFFRRAAEQARATAVALAHHADDNVETVLFRIFRGTGLRGLAGIPPVRDLGGGLRVVRPLLDFSREQLLDWARTRNLPWREDPSNQDPAYRRNVLRHELLPLVRQSVNPDVSQAILRLADQAHQAERFVQACARAALAESLSHSEANRVLIEADRLAFQQGIVRTTALREVLEDLHLPQRNLSADHLSAVDRLLFAPSGRVNLPGGFSATRRGSQLLLAGPVRDDEARQTDS